MKAFSRENQGGLKAHGHGPGAEWLHRASDNGAPNRGPTMTRLELEYRDAKNGMIDYDRYRRLDTTVRRETRSRMILRAWSWLAAYFKFPQNRWMRRQASSKSEVLVA
jgi:hypothetical protein